MAPALPVEPLVETRLSSVFGANRFFGTKSAWVTFPLPWGGYPDPQRAESDGLRRIGRDSDERRRLSPRSPGPGPGVQTGQSALGAGLEDDDNMSLLTVSQDKVEQYFESVEVGMRERGWGGTWFEFGNGNADVELIPGEGESAGTLSLATSRGGEVSKRKLSPEGAKEFDASDAAECGRASPGQGPSMSGLPRRVGSFGAVSRIGSRPAAWRAAGSLRKAPSAAPRPRAVGA